jgi:broad specificity phosphatase PhoE
MPAPTIYYIRHDETAWNAEGRFQGTQDIPLNDLGRRQAAEAGGILTDLFARDGRNQSSLTFVASPLSRARSTMELVRGVLKLPTDGYAVDARLREIGYGRWEGATLAQMQASDPEIFAARLSDKWTVPPPDGESYASVQARDERLVQPAHIGHRRGGPWRHRAGADGGARRRDVRQRRRPDHRAGRRLRVRRWRAEEI